MNELERIVEGYLKQQVKKAGGLSFKWTSPARRGVPDQIVIIDGSVWFVEVKRTKGVLTQLQTLTLRQLAEAGANTFVVYGKEGVDEFLRHCAAKVTGD